MNPSLAFDVLLAVALSVQRVAVGLVVEAALAAAPAVPAAQLAEVPVRGLAHVALGPGDAGLAVALSVGRALQQLGADRVAVAGLAGRPPEGVLGLRSVNAPVCGSLNLSYHRKTSAFDE